MGRIEWAIRITLTPRQGILTTLGSMFRQTTGVASRKLINLSGGVDGIWTYTPTLKPTGTEEREMTNTVKTPPGDKTVYYFSVNTTANGPEWTKSDYALSFTKNEFDRPRNPTNNVALASSGAVATASSMVNSGYAPADNQWRQKGIELGQRRRMGRWNGERVPRLATDRLQREQDHRQNQCLHVSGQLYKSCRADSGYDIRHQRD